MHSKLNIISYVPSCALYLIALTIQWVLLILLSTIFLFWNSSANKAVRNDDSNTVRISLPFKDQVAAYAVRKQLHNLKHKIGPTLQPVFVSKKLGQDLKPKEIKPSIVIKQCVLTIFHVISAMQIMSGTQPHYTFINALVSTKIQQSVDISKKLTVTTTFWKNINSQLRKCQDKFGCLVFEMLFIRNLKPNLNIQRDSIRTKLFA